MKLVAIHVSSSNSADMIIVSSFCFVLSKIGKEAMGKNVMFDLLMFSKEKPQECFIYSVL